MKKDTLLDNPFKYKYSGEILKIITYLLITYRKIPAIINPIMHRRKIPIITIIIIQRISIDAKMIHIL